MSESRVLVLRCGHLWGPKFYKSLRDTLSLKAKAIPPSGTPEGAKAGGSLCPVPRGLKIQLHTIFCLLLFASLDPDPTMARKASGHTAGIADPQESTHCHTEISAISCFEGYLSLLALSRWAATDQSDSPAMGPSETWCLCQREL